MTLTILAANLWLLPYPFSIDIYKRINHSAEIITTCQPDFICLQEVWLLRHLKLIISKLTKYKIFYQHHFLFNSTGLAFLSKLQPISSNQQYFPNTFHTSFTERVAHKGFQLNTILDHRTPITIINTHLYCWYSQPEKIINQNQLQQLLNLAAAQKHLTLLAGDLNLPYHDMKSLIPSTFILEDNQEPTASRNNPYQRSRFNKPLTKKDDYVIIYPSTTNIKSFTTTVVKSPLISNHYPLLAKITF